MAARRVVLLHARDKPLNISKPSLTKELMKVLNFARLSKREPRWQIATTLISKSTLLFLRFAFFMQLNKSSYSQNCCLEYINICFIDSENFFRAKRQPPTFQETISDMPRVGFWRKDIEDWHWLKSWYRFHKIFTKCLRCVSHLVTCLSPSGGSRCLEFFYALVSTQQKSFNAGSKLSVDTTVNKRVEERITVSKKKE